MIVRAILIVAAAAVIAYAATSLHHDDACASASRRAFAVSLGAPAGGLRATVATIASQCRGTTELAAAASALLRVGDTRQAIATARTATHREPANFLNWVALWEAEKRTDPAAAAHARARAHQLNPRYGATS